MHEIEAVRQDREDFLHEFYWCMACGKVPAVDVHEIARGAHRRAAYATRISWLSLCRRCHDQMDDYSVWPVSRQYSLKRKKDPDNYDRVALNRLRGRDDNAITDEEVEQHVFSDQGQEPGGHSGRR